MPRNSKRGMSHSLKKIQRRGGVVNMRCTKSKRKQASRAENTRPNRKKKVPRGDPDGDVQMADQPAARTNVAARAEARVQLGRESRQAEFAKRRGLATPAILSAAAGHGAPASAGDDEPDAAAAGRAAERALSAAPRNQRSFQKELARVLRESDVLLEVLDARDPMGCRCAPLEEAVLSRMTSKRVVLILNKIDLIPPDNARRWLAYLRQFFPTVPFKASGGGGGRGGGMSAASAGGAEAFGGEQLLQLLKNYSRSAGIKTAITVGVVGYPNVGKSSLINALKRSRAVTVGATPGVTTVAQIVSIDKRVKLVDCPGIVFARPSTPAEAASVLLRNCVKVEKMEDLHAPIEALLLRATAEQLREHFGIARFESATEFLTLVALKRGKLGKGGAPDHDAAARAVLQEWNAGTIAYHSEPPKQKAEVTIVSHLGEEFDWHAAPPKVRKEGEPDSEDDDDAMGGGAEEDTVGGGTGSGGSHGAPQPMQAEQAGAAGGPGRNASRPSSGRTTATGAGGGGGGSIFGSVQTLAERAQGQRAPKRGKKERVVQPRKKPVVDDEARYNPQMNRSIRKRQQADAKKKRRDLARTVAPFVEAIAAGAPAR